MDDILPNSLLAQCLIAYLLGMKHGLDADHLATIDSLTRHNAHANPRLARFCGVWFSLGHGAVVVAVAVAASTLTRHWRAPDWLGLCGAWISIGFLLALGLLNMRAMLGAAAEQAAYPVGLKGRLFSRFSNAARPGLVALVGALFALSFDTVSQASLFAISAVQFGGWRHAALLGLLFTLGMLAADGINGFWISRLLRHADQVAVIASRIMGWVVVGVSLLVAGFGVLKLSMPEVEAWSEGKELFFGVAVALAAAGSYLLAMAVARARRPASI
jgi:high-affinity nickel-transport protein